MKELFDWVPWFNELARKIADGGQEYLDDRAKEVDWRGDAPLGDAEEIDPLFFITDVARRTRDPKRGNDVSVSLANVFGTQPLQSDIWHSPGVHGFEYHDSDDPGNKKVTWNLLRAAASRSLDAATFHSASRLPSIGWAKLTGVLFLIDATSHLRMAKGKKKPRWPAKAYGVQEFAQKPSWDVYQSRIEEARTNFRGCELYEIEMFARLQSSKNEYGQALRVRPDRCWIATTNASRGTQAGDLWNEFEENYWVRVENSTEYPVDRPEPGDLMLARSGDHGRGIGVVYRNDYGKERNPEGRIHVLWLNKSSCEFERRIGARAAFAEASESQKTAFRQRTEYAPTWKVIDNGGDVPPLEEHTANQILYGPPGTGKTYATVGHALAIIDGSKVKVDITMADQQRFRDLRFRGRPERSSLAAESESLLRSAEATREWEEFLAVWPPNRVRNMSLDDYTNLNRDHAFIYSLEAKTGRLGSIWGGSAFKFGIYRRLEKEAKARKGGRIWGEEYAWMRKYGETAEEVFAEVRSRLVKVIDAAREGDFEAVDDVDFSSAVKWKVAFLYQDRQDPGLLAIYKQDRLRARYNEAFPNAVKKAPPCHQQHADLIAHYEWLGDALDISPLIWHDPKDQPPPETPETDGRIAMVTFHQNYAYEDFLEGIRPELAGRDDRSSAGETAGASSSSRLEYELRPGIFRRICEVAESERQAAEDESREPKRFVLIIDEINRGNIPKIFGELITLIEDSKRLGAGDATTVTLPYSGDEFGVPDNLYIIGTMNTADRSIQQLDTALRRRFTFVEMMPAPDHELISEDVDGVNCRRMLRAMNERIAVLLDREHQIGHTYLLNVTTLEQLADAFRNRIFPLLQEYFYDDWRKIRAVLGGNAFVMERKIGEGYTKDLIQEFDLANNETIIYERLSARDSRWTKAAQYRMIYGCPPASPDIAAADAD